MSEVVSPRNIYISEIDGTPWLHLTRWFGVVAAQGFASQQEIEALPVIAEIGRFTPGAELDQFLSDDWSRMGQSIPLTRFAIDAVVFSKNSVENKVSILTEFAHILGYRALMVEDGRRTVLRCVKAAHKKAFSNSVFHGADRFYEHIDELLWRARTRIPRQPFSHRLSEILGPVIDRTYVEDIDEYILRILQLKMGLHNQDGSVTQE